MAKANEKNTVKHNWPNAAPGFILVRARKGKLEKIGRVAAGRQSSAVEVFEDWTWSPMSQGRPVGIWHPGYLTSGFTETQRGVRDARLAAWWRKRTFRAQALTYPTFAELRSNVQDFLMNGQPFTKTTG